MTFDISKWSSLIIVIIASCVWIFQKIKDSKNKLPYFRMLLLIFLFFILACGRIPNRYEKLQQVNLIREGRWEKAQENLDYLTYRRITYDGDSGKEDVLFMQRKEIRTEEAYYKYAYLYSDDNKTDADTGVWEVVDVRHLEGKWYKVTLRLFI